MEATRPAVLEMLYECIDALNEMRSRDQQLARSPETRLAGEGAGLDSLGFVNLVALVEEKTLERFGKTLVLNEAGFLSSDRDPFATIGALAEQLHRSLIGQAAERE